MYSVGSCHLYLGSLCRIIARHTKDDVFVNSVYLISCGNRTFWAAECDIRD